MWELWIAWQTVDQSIGKMYSEQIAKLICCYSCLANFRAKCAFGDLVVIGDRQATMWGHPLYQDHMTALLSIQRIANFTRGVKHFPARDDR